MAGATLAKRVAVLDAQVAQLQDELRSVQREAEGLAANDWRIYRRRRDAGNLAGSNPPP